MSVEELRRLAEHLQNHGIRNINCGMMRRIGKTQYLRQMIMEHYYSSNSQRIYVLTPNIEMGRNWYMELYRTRVVEIVSPRNVLQQLSGRIDFFSDEVPNAEQLISQTPHNFILGFYSTDILESHQLLSEDNLQRLHEREIVDRLRLQNQLINSEDAQLRVLINSEDVKLTKCEHNDKIKRKNNLKNKYKFINR